METSDTPMAQLNRLTEADQGLYQIIRGGVLERMSFVTTWDLPTRRLASVGVAKAVLDAIHTLCGTRKQMTSRHALKVVRLIKLLTDEYVAAHGGPDGYEQYPKPERDPNRDPSDD